MKSSLPSEKEYAAAFARECANEYPVIDEIEKRLGYAIDRQRLENAARTLACPVKRNPPNWQHGRVIYSVLRKYLEGRDGFLSLFDCGTAKGFSALCMAFALTDAALTGAIVSVDVIDPDSAMPRNSVLDLEGPKTVRDYVRSWPEAALITFRKSTGAEWLRSDPGRIHCAFIDGKHQYSAVKEEIHLLKHRQMQGDIAIFDDLQIPGVDQAVTLSSGYALTFVDAKQDRRYAIATRI
jgi:predicted O-methyltransferase YrrM